MLAGGADLPGGGPLYAHRRRGGISAGPEGACRLEARRAPSQGSARSPELQSPSTPSSICSAAAAAVGAVGYWSQARSRRWVRFGIAAWPVLDGRAEGGHLDPADSRLGRKQVDRLEQRGAASFQLATERSAEASDTRADTCWSESPLGKQAQRRLVPTMPPPAVRAGRPGGRPRAAARWQQRRPERADLLHVVPRSAASAPRAVQRASAARAWESSRRPTPCDS